MSIVFCLRTCDNNFKAAHNGFQWPNEIGAKAYPEHWNPEKECGNGLHGFLNGEGDKNLADWSDSAQWLVFSADSETLVNLGEKIKVPEATIAHIGRGKTAFDRLQDCHAFLRVNNSLGLRAFKQVTIGGNGCTFTGGNGCTFTGGNDCTFTGGDCCTFTGGNDCTFTGGYGCTFTGGDHCTFTGGNGCTFTGGDCCTFTGGYGCAFTGGYGCAFTGGDCCTFTYRFFDKNTQRYHIRTAYTGENGILANVTYKVNENGDLMPV